MKRVLVVCLALALILPVLAVSALAATSHVFYPMESVSVLDDTSSDFFGKGFYSFVIDSLLPDGLYNISIIRGSTVTYYTPDPVAISFSGGSPLTFSQDVAFLASGSRLVDLGVRLSYGDDGGTYLSIFEYGAQMTTLDADYIRFDLVETAESAPAFLSAVVTPEMLDGVLGQVVALLPVVLVVIVGYIALRKGVAYIRSVLKKA